MTLSFNRLLNQVSLNVKLKWQLYSMIIIIAIVILIFHYFNKEFTAFDFVSSRLSNKQFFNSSPSIDIHKFHFKWFPLFLLYVSSIITSFSFSEYSNATSTTFHLSLPSSTFEKWLSKAIIALAITPLCLILIYQAFIWISQLWPAVDEYYQVPVDVLDPHLRPHIITAILFQGVIFAFSIWYRKWSIAKALLTISVVILIYNIVMVLGIILFEPEKGLTEGLTVQSITSVSDFISSSKKSTVIRNASFIDTFYRNKYVLTGISLICLVLSFLKFKEIES